MAIRSTCTAPRCRCRRRIRRGRRERGSTARPSGPRCSCTRRPSAGCRRSAARSRPSFGARSHGNHARKTSSEPTAANLDQESPMIRTRVIGVGVLGGLMSAIIAAAPQQADVSMQTLTYASPGGQPLVLDLYEPSAARNPLPVIVFLHGGGWSGGTRTTGPDFARFFARDGFAMVSIEYRLTPAITFPSNVEDVKTAIRWLRAHAAEHRLDPNRIGLWGTSAGATLGSIAALSPPDLFEGDGNRDQS